MGIKGIYKEIGPGKRVALCKLAVDHLEQTGESLRIAIDFAIWSFQAQATRGGSNPAIRTLFYRLVRLLSLSILPIFVFDGPNKPAFKRNKRSAGPGDRVSDAMAKRLIRLFGFHIHDAPGEAEAECALLQQQGVVDAVLSEDVDTIMFGCTRTLRNWSSEGTRGSSTPTHVSVYDVAALKQGETGLDREGLVLVALMSGGDYSPEGVPGCGVKVACEAAKAGFGKRLCRIKRSDRGAVAEWKDELVRELSTNESKFFRTKHKALKIPDEFPDMQVLRYYTHPVVSQAGTVEKLQREFLSKKDINITGLQEFTAETFDWTGKIGAVKFIKVLAPGLLVRRLINLSLQQLESDDPDVRAEVEAKLVKSISTRRIHFSTDATPELRLSYIPNELVGIDLDAEEDEIAAEYGRSGLALNSDDDEEADQNGEAAGGPKKVFDPLKPTPAWVPETIAKLGAPLAVETWEGKQRAKQLSKHKKASPKKKPPRKKASNARSGALDQYVTVTKPSSTAAAAAALKELDAPEYVPPSLAQASASLPSFPPQRREKSTTAATQGAASQTFESARNKKPRAPKAKASAPASRPSLDVNPWSIASSQSQATPKASRKKSTTAEQEPILISSSPMGPPSPSPPKDDASATNPRPPTILPVDDDLDDSQDRPLLNDPFSIASSPPPPPAAVSSSKGPAPKKHNLSSSSSSAETTVKPAAKRAAATTRSTRSSATQPSIKAFGKNTEAMRKRAAAAAAAPPKPLLDFDSDDDDDDDDKLQDIRDFGSAGPRAQSQRQRLPPLEMIPSSPPPPPPPPPSPGRFATTRLYMARTSLAGTGYVRAVEVTREEADRIVSRDSGGAGGRRRIWRESDMTILDLTGQD